MARLARLSDDENEDQDARKDLTLMGRSQGRVSLESLSPSPAASFSSDKENRQASARASRRQNKGKGRAMDPPQLHTPTPGAEEQPRSSKRRKLSERDAHNASQTTHAECLAVAGDTEYYDPEQSIAERRAVRKDFRDLSRELTGMLLAVVQSLPQTGSELTVTLDSRAEYLAPGSKGLLHTLHKANQLFTSVKQTSDATLDSRLLVSTADLSAKRTTQLNLGDSTTGIDVDDFVGKCISFMRRAPAENSSARRQDDSDEEAAEGYDEGDAFNWEWLGRQACFPNNVRPPVPGFLLGPLSVQKKVRKVTQRRERFQRRDPNDAVRPEEMKARDFERSDNSDLTTLCKNIRDLLVKTVLDGQQRVYEEMPDDISDAESRALMRKHGIADDSGVPFFQFVVNPRSFGQTVENLFYVSFLIKDGTVAFANDSNMLPTLRKSALESGCELVTDI